MRLFTVASAICLSSLVSTFAFAEGGPENDTDYTLSCRFNADKIHDITFRLNGTYLLKKDGTASLDYKAVLFEDSELNFLGVYEAKIENEKNYSATSDRYKNHLKFVLKEKEGNTEDQDLIVDSVPKNCVTEKWDNHVNTGTTTTCDFHAGLNYHHGDQDGNRTQITCKGVDVKVNRKPLPKPKQ